MSIFSWRRFTIPLLVLSGVAQIAVLTPALFSLPLVAAESFTSDSGSDVISEVAAATTSPPKPDFGTNVYLFNPSMPQSEIQATVDAVANQQISNQFGTQRYALLFEPGTYGSTATPLNFQVGYYTEVAGLGVVQSHHQRDQSNIWLSHGGVLGSLAGVPDAPCPCQRANHADGLLHGSLFRKRRLHRRFRIRQ